MTEKLTGCSGSVSCIWEAQARESWLWGQPELYSEMLSQKQIGNRRHKCTGWSFETTNNICKPIARLIQTKRKKERKN